MKVAFLSKSIIIYIYYIYILNKIDRYLLYIYIGTPTPLAGKRTIQFNYLKVQFENPNIQLINK